MYFYMKFYFKNNFIFFKVIENVLKHIILKKKKIFLFSFHKFNLIFNFIFNISIPLNF